MWKNIFLSNDEGKWLRPGMDDYEVVVTRSHKCVLDIGLCDGSNPPSVLARYDGLGDGHYGGVNTIRWYHTGKYMDEDQWKSMSFQKSTEEICGDLGIQYYMEWEEEEKPMDINYSEAKKMLTEDNTKDKYVVYFADDADVPTGFLATKKQIKLLNWFNEAIGMTDVLKIVPYDQYVDFIDLDKALEEMP